MDEQWTEDFCAALRTEIATVAAHWQVKPRVIVRDAASMLTCAGKAWRAADDKRSAKR